MNISYDKQADAMYIRFQEDKVEKTIKIQEGIIIDINSNGNLLGIELLDVSLKMPLESLSHIGFDFPIEKHKTLTSA
ncbi:hypothetical protein A2230_07030 [candidate division WOR-1 bacterium RIFOXYA2_FULL_36_21]|uniref:DUF2283 domain-containing protein n=1 Tax=candidate division WOR-1 bacterium RIFOXYB2_FULL_36_35 TaxID=1802578 RepID=A0A1F4S363_UNCSA|nr:MAG: hypothetical protein A2230_07030 [candidate division WOR-1 bacterium RIFOXYA2_FULL_36_21]OGC14707.1 MAG: hypothetical protein A2282_02610 [candidate division WOR-1 bacterium RIFOXYA12_FULL_36_13]OGC14819.1 MAG: hypothetical protein A2290_00795 [candidate division WOR-1 bacterium RIFOXYB2_FULL_36_35]